MTLALYKAALTILAPVAALWLALTPSKRPLLARFHPRLPTMERSPIWVHACSVGEVSTARPLLSALQKRWPGIPILLTSSTPTGKALAEELHMADAVAWLPFDHPVAVGRFLRCMRPRALILMETELWPSLLAMTQASNVPVILANGRLSDTHAGSYRRFAALYRPMLQRLNVVAMQSQAYADRIRSLGASAECITVTGNLKFDSAPKALNEEECASLKLELGIDPGDRVVLFGSTRPGDEALAAKCWRTLIDSHPHLVFIVAPRHLDRIDEAIEALGREHTIRRSQLDATTASRSERAFIILDTHGELTSLYAIAEVAVVGGSFFAGVDGHNPIEPAAQGVCTAFGPYMNNFRDPVHALLAAEGARQVHEPGDLPEVLDTLLGDTQERQRMGNNAMNVVSDNKGATQRTLDLIADLLNTNQ